MIMEIDLEEGYVKMETDNGHLKVTEKELALFQDITISKSVQPANGTMMMALPEEMRLEFQNCSALANIVTDTIGKVQADAKYVPQAKEINSSIKNLIDLKRVQVEMLSLLKR